MNGISQYMKHYDSPFNGIQVEDTCLVALATAYNARETEGGTTKQELLHFVEEVSFVCAHTHTHKGKLLW